jgi:hypothetical protein
MIDPRSKTPNRDFSSVSEMEEGGESWLSHSFLTKYVGKRPGRCLDLTAVTLTHLETLLYPEATDDLCEICSQKDFARFTKTTCDKHTFNYHLGKVQNIQKRKGCPFCRLVSAVRNSAHLRTLKFSAEDPLICTIFLGPYSGNHSLL